MKDAFIFLCKQNINVPIIFLAMYEIEFSFQGIQNAFPLKRTMDKTKSSKTKGECCVSLVVPLLEFPL